MPEISFYIPLLFNQVTTCYTPESIQVLEDYRFFDQVLLGRIIGRDYRSIIASVSIGSRHFTAEIKVPIDESKPNQYSYCLVDEHYYPVATQTSGFKCTAGKSDWTELAALVNYSESFNSKYCIDVSSQFVMPVFKKSSRPDTGNKHKVKKYYSEYTYHFSLFLDRNILIVGSAGSGKTTMMRRIVNDLINDAKDRESEDSYFPLYLQLRTVDYQNSTLENALDHIFKSLFAEQILFSFEEFASCFNVVLLLDGLDEVPSAHFENVLTWVKELSIKIKTIRIIISSRLMAFSKELNSFHLVNVNQFNDDQIRELTYQNLTDNGEWRNFLSILNESPKVKSFASNPLMLSLMHDLYRNKYAIPSNTFALAKDCSEMLLRRWDNVREINRYFAEDYSPQIIRFHLLRLAYNSIGSNKNVFGRNDVVKWLDVGDDAKLADELCNAISEKTSILVKSGNSWEFAHKTFAEYFSAAYLVESFKGKYKKYLKDDQWLPTKLLLGGMTAEPETLITFYCNEATFSLEKRVIDTLNLLNESFYLNEKSVNEIFYFTSKYFTSIERRAKISIKSCTPNKIVFHKGGTSKIDRLSDVLRVLVKTRWSRYGKVIGDHMRTSDSTICREVYSFFEEKDRLVIRFSNVDLTIIRTKESPDISL